MDTLFDNLILLLQPVTPVRVTTTLSGGAPTRRREILVARTRPLLSFSFRLRFPISGHIRAKPKQIRISATTKPLNLVAHRPVKPKIQIYSFQLLRSITGHIRTPITRLCIAQTTGNITVTKQILTFKLTGNITHKERWIP